MHHSESTVAQKLHHCDVKSGAGEAGEEQGDER